MSHAAPTDVASAALTTARILPRALRAAAIALTAAGIALLAGCTSVPVAAQPTPTGALTGDWKPIDEGVDWSDAEVTVPQYLGECRASTTSAWRDGEEWVTAVVWDCGDPAAAASLIPAYLGDHRAPPATDIPPALGDGIDLAVRYVDGSVARFWSQGGMYVSVGASCGVRDCVSATDRYADALSADLGGIPNRLLEKAPVSDVLAGFIPSGGTAPWVLVGDVTFAPDGLQVPDCLGGRQRVWVSSDRQVARLYTMDCPDASLALRAFTTQWGAGSGLTQRPDLAGVLGFGYDSAGLFAPNEDTTGIARSWVQGRTYVNVQRLCDPKDPDVCAEGSQADARAVAEELPGDIVQDSRTIDQVSGLLLFLFAVPLAALVAFAVIRAVLMRRRQRGFDIGTDRPDFVSVDRTVRRGRMARISRRAIVIGGTVVVWLWIVFLLSGASGSAAAGSLLLAFGLWFFLGPFVVAAAITLLLSLLWRPGPLHRIARSTRGTPTFASVSGAALRVLARVMAIVAILLYALTSLLLVLVVKSQTPAVTAAQNAAGFAGGDPLGWLLSLLRSVIVTLDGVGGFPLLFVVLVVGPLTIAYLLDRLGRRLSQRSLDAVLAHDIRPHFLYLRGFEEDTLRVDASLTRRGFIEALTPLGRPRFEEVLVGYLSRFGPVIAISARSQRVPEIGAAKMSFGGDEWQDRVREWIGDARAVVMAATPAQVRRGLEWEIAQLADSPRPPRVMLIVAPWPREELARRWEGFIARAAAWPLFAPLAERPFPSGVEILTWTSEDGWRGYGARRRWDWSYAAAILAGVEAATPAWDRQRAAEKDVLSATAEPPVMPVQGA